MELAISIVEKKNPFDEKLGIYSQILGTERQTAIRRNLKL
jgi:hypothetical protein